MDVGCFEIELVDASKGKWEVKNRLTGFHYATYGSEAEVVQLLTEQSRVWEYRAKHPGKSLKGFRSNIAGEANKAKAIKAAAARAKELKKRTASG